VKVLHIIKSLGRGGAETLLPETLKLHDRSKFEFHYIYFLPWKNQMEGSIESAGGRVTCIPANNNLQLLAKTARVSQYVREHKIELIHAHLPWAGVLARLVGRRTGVPVIYTEHNKQERYHFATRILNLRTLNLLDTLICVSSDVEASVRKHKPSLSAPVRTILNGVNHRHYQRDPEKGSAVRRDLGFGDDAIIIGTIAVFRFQKRLNVWIDTARKIHQRLPNARFVIVGDGPLKNELTEQVRALGLENIIVFTGLQEETRPYLSAMDIYMMSSIFEGLPIALLEAMACGCPVVTTDAGGIKEVIRYNTDGLMCTVDDTDNLVEMVCGLGTNPIERERLARNARKRIEESFSLQSMVSQLESLYFEVKKRKR
jgi:Glycosyltransferase